MSEKLSEDNIRYIAKFLQVNDLIKLTIINKSFNNAIDEIYYK